MGFQNLSSNYFNASWYVVAKGAIENGNFWI